MIIDIVCGEDIVKTKSEEDAEDNDKIIENKDEDAEWNRQIFNSHV